MAEIELTKGYSVIVDSGDFEMLRRWKWQADATSRKRVYAKRSVSIDNKRTTIYMHRLIMKAARGMDVDHINGDTLDNRRENLRICSRQDNLRNSRKQDVCSGRRTSSRFKGVVWLKREKKWRANIRIDKGNRLCLGYFDNETDAARAYDAAAHKHHGEFARLNFPLICEVAE